MTYTTQTSSLPFFTPKVNVSTSLQDSLPVHAHSRLQPPRHSPMALKIAVKKRFAHFLSTRRLQSPAHVGTVEPLDSLSGFPFLINYSLPTCMRFSPR